ncbi:MAG: endonuclease VII domain-containing protein, partial [Chloroflexota bacterium]|nr:endonuclease VII domain-containing protein [Chloroflexota bacterium]
PELRVKRGKRIMALAPAGTAWCAGCQSFRDLVDFRKGATTCRACASAAQHGAMIERTYGLGRDEYDVLLELQGGRCAVCRTRPKSKRLVVDHDHKTGAVRGLLCARCNHEGLGSMHDSLALVTAMWHYMNTPPASGAWVPPETAPQLEPVGGAVRPSKASGGEVALVAAHGQKASERPRKAAKRAESAPLEECPAIHYRPAGSVGDPNGPGYWRIYVVAGAEVPPPF